MLRLLNGFVLGFGAAVSFGVPAKAAENPQTSVSNTGKEADVKKNQTSKAEQVSAPMRELGKQVNRYTAKRNWKKH